LSGNRQSRLSGGELRSRAYTAVIVSVVAGVLFGCFSSVIVNSRKQFYAGNASAAANTLAKIKEKEGKDRILALMDYGMALHVAGNYRESANALLEANRLIELNDVVKVGEKAGSMVTNKMMTTFRPESFERVLVHTYLMIDFMMLDDWSAARVEAKQALKVLDNLDPELQDQTFTRYVCGLAFEVMGDNDDAYIEYSKVAKESPNYLQIHYELYRIASLGGRSQDAEKWAKKITALGGIIPADLKPPNLIIFVGAGRSPIKKEINILIPPYANRFVVPDYVSSGSRAKNAVLKVNNVAAASYMLTDLDPLAEKTLKKRIAKEIAEEAARVAAKEAITRQIEDQNALLGLGARVVFFASEAADVRSWETLPRYLGVITRPLPAGTYDLSVEFFSNSGASLGTVEKKSVTISDNRRTVLSMRSVQ